MRNGKAVAVTEAVVGINALGGMAYALAGADAVPVEWLEGSPFRSYRVPGLYLGVVIGGSALRAAALSWRGDPRACGAVLGSAAVVLTWIGAQVAIIGYRSPLQPAIAATGAVLAYAALRP